MPKTAIVILELMFAPETRIKSMEDEGTQSWSCVEECTRAALTTLVYESRHGLAQGFTESSEVMRSWVVEGTRTLEDRW